MEKIARAAEEFIKVLNDKGYDNIFLINQEYPGRLQNSLNDFLNDPKNEPERMENGFVLDTFLEWNGGLNDNALVTMYAKLQDEKIEINKMEIKLSDLNGKVLKSVMVEGLTTASIPTIEEAIAKVKPLISEKEIDDLVKQIKDKGYPDSYENIFKAHLSLKEGIQKHIEEVNKEVTPQNMFPFHFKIIMPAKEADSHHCSRFAIDWDDKKGMHISGIRLEKYTSKTELKNIDVKSALDIPTLKKANEMLAKGFDQKKRGFKL